MGENLPSLPKITKKLWYLLALIYITIISLLMKKKYSSIAEEIILGMTHSYVNVTEITMTTCKLIVTTAVVKHIYHSWYNISDDDDDLKHLNEHI